MFMDYYCVWGKGKVIDSWDGMEENYNTKIISSRYGTITTAQRDAVRDATRYDMM